MTEEKGFASIRLASADDCGTAAFTLRLEDVESPRTDTYQVPAAGALLPAKSEAVGFCSNICMNEDCSCFRFEELRIRCTRLYR